MVCECEIRIKRDDTTRNLWNLAHYVGRGERESLPG